MYSREWTRALKASVAVGREQHVTVTAAGLGYYAFNSLVPLLLLVTIAISIVYDPETTASAIESVSGLRATEIEPVIAEVTGNGGARTRAGLIAAGIFAYSTVTMFQAVNMAFSEIYGTRKRRSGLRKGTDTLLIFATVLIAVSLIGAVGVALVLRVDSVAVSVLSVPLLLGAFFLAFLPMYYRFPGQSVTLGEAMPGAAFSAVAWTLSALFFRVYAATADSVALYGIAGAVLLVLTWLYLGGLILLFGAIFNAVLAGRVDADEGWLPTEGS
ncbi:YihY/virulence factor BrkB family protein [Halalkalicoccus jeotgali]|uniref:Ribonuclease BN n=1 Tax=Halalkalicoccus jeotgali (strain DSM 18796 / CECT 7217 / JCM 14584 / KCTC 4019 / B3) TaxID=795797 RepID=D8J7V5_HALJB|nr:YihY/virulence factor BrkB family protein [Halalkalicoccus jeotgali]ADJ16125.1 ribonuclease BN [Halalkalicoccus jeotgali B3]ELY37554.1 ribonuclease BN [Halalkalicoccus jeotgali B3]